MQGQGSPTATVIRVDMSARRRASATPASPEVVLFRAYGSVRPGQSGVFKVVDPRQEVCACGGKLVDNDSQPIPMMVAAHNETPLHQAWRAWRELL